MASVLVVAIDGGMSGRRGSGAGAAESTLPRSPFAHINVIFSGRRKKLKTGVAATNPTAEGANQQGLIAWAISARS
jgi:hypothetical protein